MGQTPNHVAQGCSQEKLSWMLLNLIDVCIPILVWVCNVHYTASWPSKEREKPPITGSPRADDSMFPCIEYKSQGKAVQICADQATIADADK